LQNEIESGKIQVFKRTDDIAVVVGGKGKRKDKKKKGF